jgi:hypothetical protein
VTAGAKRDHAVNAISSGSQRAVGAPIIKKIGVPSQGDKSIHSGGDSLIGSQRIEIRLSVGLRLRFDLARAVLAFDVSTSEDS